MTNEEFMTLVLQRFDAIDERLENIEKRLDNVEKRLDNVEKRLDNVEKRLDNVEKRLDNLERQQSDVDYILKQTFEEVTKHTSQLGKFELNFKRIDKKFDVLNDHILEREADVKLLLDIHKLNDV
ncbi:MAG: Dynamitin [Thermoanaerobacterium sp.]|nr:Dynamitin [Thermoanaerobacterium sp.]